MKIKNLDVTKYKRFFAFGCSFTNYKWATWADIIGQDIKEYYNYGLQGAGNHYIYNKLMEADCIHNFNSDDLVIVMWTKTDREDRYANDRWETATSTKGRTAVYGAKWFKKYGDQPKGDLMRDLAYIKGAQALLEKTNWANLAMHYLCTFDIEKAARNQQETRTRMELKAVLNQIQRDLCNGIDTEIKNEYLIAPDVLYNYRTVYRNIEYCVEDLVLFEDAVRDDPHPTPLEALRYLDLVYPNNNISPNARSFAAQT